MPETCTSIINLRYPPGSVGSASNPEKFDKNQDYNELRNIHVQRKKLFVDRTFPPNNSSLGDMEALTADQEAQVRWCRPKEIMEILDIRGDPVFTSCSKSRFDFEQGSVANCWVLTAISSLTLNKRLMAQVVPEQSFDNYAGIFHFRFWRFGKWVDVVIDDYLPVYQNQFLSVSSKETNEFWAPLMEKAYAKVCGSYADMDRGWMDESCKDMTGGFSLNFKPLHQVHDDDRDAQLWRSLTYGSSCKSMMCCSTRSGVRTKGLVDLHAYSITKATEVYFRGSKVKLLRLLNPWGSGEWNGNWSDSSPLWKQVSHEDRAKCNKDENGEFWIELEDFFQNFDCLTICCENPNFMDGDLSCQWQLMIHEGNWTTGSGSLTNHTFHTNPQFRITIDIKNEEEHFDMNCFFSLMQKPNEKKRNKAQYSPIAIYIFQIPHGTSPGRLDRIFFVRNRPIRKPDLTRDRDVTEWCSLDPGEYLVVPVIQQEYMGTEFVLSVYTKSLMEIYPFEGEDEDEYDCDHDNDHSDHNDDFEEVTEIPTKDEESEARELYDQYADWREGLNARQLQRLLNNSVTHGIWNGFSRDTCMDFIIMMNTDNRPRMMNFEEFSELWKKINKYKQIFMSADTNHNGVLNQAELNGAVQAAGLPSSDGWGDMAVFRYTFGTSDLNMLSFLDLMIHLDHRTSFFNNHVSEGFLNIPSNDWFAHAALF